MQIIPDPMFTLWMTLPFAVAAIALHVILVRPLQQWLEGRDGAIQGARHEAESLAADAEAQVATLEARLKAARTEAGQIREAARQRGLEAESQAQAKARDAADARLAEALKSIADERDTAKAALQASTDVIAQDIAARVLGRTPVA